MNPVDNHLRSVSYTLPPPMYYNEHPLRALTLEEALVDAKTFYTDPNIQERLPDKRRYLAGHEKVGQRLHTDRWWYSC